jgi:hypothetical protein
MSGKGDSCTTGNDKECQGKKCQIKTGSYEGGDQGYSTAKCAGTATEDYKCVYSTGAAKESTGYCKQL